MPITLRITGNGLEPGVVVELFHGPPYTDRELDGRKTLPVLASTPLPADGLVSFPSQSLPCALRLKKGAKVFARSNGMTQLPAPVEGVSRVTVLQVNSVFTPGTIGGLVPPLPIVEDKIRVTALTIDLVADAMRLRGTVVRDGAIDIDFTFTALVNIHPTTRPVFNPTLGEDTPDHLCTVEIVDIDVKGVRRLEGVVVNLFRGTVRRRMERAIQTRIHQRVQEQGEQLGPAVTMTEAVTNNEELRLTLAGWIPLIL